MPWTTLPRDKGGRPPEHRAAAGFEVPEDDALSQGWTQPGIETPGPLAGAVEVKGRKVLNRLDEPLGEVQDLLVDVQSGRIAYALMAAGGVLGIGERHFPLPWTALTLDRERRCFVLDASRWAFDSAPMLPKDRGSAGIAIDWHENVHRFYGARPYWD
ncbi:MAG: PRC-barrel domain-containing protein [Rubrivivax sp.]